MGHTVGELLACQRLPHNRLLRSPMPLARLGDSGPGVTSILWVGRLLLGIFSVPCLLIFSDFSFPAFDRLPIYGLSNHTHSRAQRSLSAFSMIHQSFVVFILYELLMQSQVV